MSNGVINLSADKPKGFPDALLVQRASDAGDGSDARFHARVSHKPWASSLDRF